MSLQRRVPLALVLVPRAADACASCISSAYGDRTYNWPDIGVMLTPFALMIAVGAVLSRCYVASRRRSPALTDSNLDEEAT